MYLTILENNKSIAARLDEIANTKNMIASSQRMLVLTTSNMYDDEEFIGENVDMEVSTKQQVQTFKECAPPSTRLENLNLDHEKSDYLKDADLFSNDSCMKDRRKMTPSIVLQVFRRLFWMDKLNLKILSHLKIKSMTISLRYP